MTEYDRRNVLGIGGALALAPVVGLPRRPRGGIQKAVKIGMVQVEGSLLDKFAALREIGFDGVELDSPSELDFGCAYLDFNIKATNGPIACTECALCHKDTCVLKLVQ